jgi:hypothetical protein
VDPTSGRIRRVLVTAGGDADPPQLLGALADGTAVIRARGEAETVNLLAWQVATGRFSLLSTVDSQASIALADLAAGA